MPATETPLPRVGATDPPLPDGSPKDLATFRELLNNRRYLRGSAWGTLEGENAVAVGGNAAAPSLAAGVVEAAAVRDSTGQWWPAFANAATVTPGALAASTVHYLYLRAATDGTVSYVVSTTAPTGCYRASGSELQRLVCAFCTGLLGYPLPAVARERSGRYVASSGRSELVALAAGRATTWTAVDLSHLVPPSATAVHVLARVYRAAADAGVRELRVRRSSADGGYLVAAAALASSAGGGDIDTYVEQAITLPILGQSFEYELSAAVTASDPYGARFIALGWE